MEITFLENGLDSLQKGFVSLKEYEKSLYTGIELENEKSRFFKLKDAILGIQHGIEILLKFLLIRNNELLIFSTIDEKVKFALQEKRKKNFNSVFQTNQSNKLHTVTFSEAIERVTMICGYDFSKKLKEKLSKLEEYRNQIMHSEIYFNELDVNHLFESFLDELDIIFLNAIGSDYQTLSGYSSLKRNFEDYKEYFEKNNMELKSKVFECFLKIFDEIKLGMGTGEVKRITDINKVTKIFEILFSQNFKFGTDIYNGYCSGDVSSIKRVGEHHFSIYTEDNQAEYTFKFKSIILFIPEITQNTSPLLFIECDEDKVEKELMNQVKEGISEIKTLEGIHFIDENRTTYNKKEINDFYSNVDNDYELYSVNYYTISKFLTKGIFCFLNIQSLQYGNAKEIIYKQKKMDGKKLEILIRNGLEKD